MRQCYAAGPSAPHHVVNPNRFGIVHGDDDVEAATASRAWGRAHRRLRLPGGRSADRAAADDERAAGRRRRPVRRCGAAGGSPALGCVVPRRLRRQPGHPRGGRGGRCPGRPVRHRRRRPQHPARAPGPRRVCRHPHRGAHGQCIGRERPDGGGAARRRPRCRRPRVGLLRRGGRQPHDARDHDRRPAVRDGDAGEPARRGHRRHLGRAVARGGPPRPQRPRRARALRRPRRARRRPRHPHRHRRGLPSRGHRARGRARPGDRAQPPAAPA